MKLFRYSIFLLPFLFSNIYADEGKVLGEDRKHSVRKIVDSLGKIEQKEISIVDNFRHMFEDGKVTGQVRTMHLNYNNKSSIESDNYTTALGGSIKYELAEFNGFNAGAAVYTSHDINALTGDKAEHNPEFSSTSGTYTEMAEAYINYRYKDFNFRGGRQAIDTPLADTDDIRMVQNTFNAYIASYTFEGLEFMFGNLQSWQGVDADLDLGWSPTGENGTYFGGVTYTDVLEFSVWYYNISELTNAAYAEVGVHYEINENILLHGVAQYLNEQEINNSGVAADIYGVLFEFVAYDLGFSVAYNNSKQHLAKESFSGFGGGTLFTSMDTLIIDDITADRDVQATVAGISYSVENFGFLYAYGDFKGDANSLGVKEHRDEQDIGFEYSVQEEFLISAVYSMQRDKESDAKTLNDWDRLQVMVNYNF